MDQSLAKTLLDSKQCDVVYESTPPKKSTPRVLVGIGVVLSLLITITIYLLSYTGLQHNTIIAQERSIIELRKDVTYNSSRQDVTEDQTQKMLNVLHAVDIRTTKIETKLDDLKETVDEVRKGVR